MNREMLNYRINKYVNIHTIQPLQSVDACRTGALRRITEQQKDCHGGQAGEPEAVRAGTVRKRHYTSERHSHPSVLQAFWIYSGDLLFTFPSALAKFLNGFNNSKSTINLYMACLKETIKKAV